MRTLRSRYRNFKMAELQEFYRFERAREEAPFLKSLVTKNKRPPRRGLADFALFAFRERWVRVMGTDAPGRNFFRLRQDFPILPGVNDVLLEKTIEKRRRLIMQNTAINDFDISTPNRKRIKNRMLRSFSR